MSLKKLINLIIFLKPSVVIQMYFIIDVYVLPFKDGDFNCLVLMQM